MFNVKKDYLLNSERQNLASPLFHKTLDVTFLNESYFAWLKWILFCMVKMNIIFAWLKWMFCVESNRRNGYRIALLSLVSSFEMTCFLVLSVRETNSPVAWWRVLGFGRQKRSSSVTSVYQKNDMKTITLSCWESFRAVDCERGFCCRFRYGEHC